MDQIELTVQPRSVTGKKVKTLRAQGWVPLVVYGRKTASINAQAVKFDVRRAITQASGQLIALNIEGEDSPRMTLAREAQWDVITGDLLHVDMYEADVTERVRIEVFLRLVGASPLVSIGQAILVSTLNSVEIECLPTAIMQTIAVDVSGLVDLNDAIYVRDLVVPEDVVVLAPQDEMVAKLEPILEEEEEEAEGLEEVEITEVTEVEVIRRGKVEEEEE